MTPTQYIHVRNWDRYQHPDTRRSERPVPWIKSHVQQLGEYDYIALTFRQRGLLEGLRLLYAANRGRGLGLNAAQLGRMLGSETVRMRDLTSLNHAGYIDFSASRTLATGKNDLRVDVDVDVDVDKDLATASREDLSTGSLFVPEQATNEAEWREAVQYGVESDPDADIPLLAAPANGRHLELVPAAATSNISARPRDDIWDLLEIKFGPVGAKGSNAHAKRNKACADLRRAGATVELVRAACDRWPAVFASATLTDAALATHYPLLAVPLLAKANRSAPCAECELGGGAHAQGCSRAVA